MKEPEISNRADEAAAAAFRAGRFAEAQAKGAGSWHIPGLLHAGMAARRLGDLPAAQRLLDRALVTESVLHEKGVLYVEPWLHMLASPGGNDLAIWAPDGKTLALADQHRATIFDAATLRPLREILAAARVASLAYTPDGQTLVVGDAGGDLASWDPASGRRTDSFVAHVPADAQVAFSADGALIAWTGFERRIHVRRWTSKPGSSWSIATPLKPFALAFSPDGRTLAYVGWRPYVHLVDAATGQARGKLLGQFGAPVDWLPQIYLGSVAFSADGDTLVAGGWMGMSSAWTRATDGSWPKEAQLLPDVAEPVRRVTFAGSGRKLLIEGSPGAVAFDGVGSPPIRPAGLDSRDTAALSADGRWLATIGRGKDPKGGPDLAVWDTSTWKETRRRPLYEETPGVVSFSGDGAQVLTIGDRGLQTWDVATGTPGAPTALRSGARSIASAEGRVA